MAEPVVAVSRLDARYNGCRPVTLSLHCMSPRNQATDHLRSFHEKCIGRIAFRLARSRMITVMDYQSNAHWAWFIEKCSKLKFDFRYTSDTVFDTFPWPQTATCEGRLTPWRRRRASCAACAPRRCRNEGRLARTLSHPRIARRESVEGRPRRARHLRPHRLRLSASK